MGPIQQTELRPITRERWLQCLDEFAGEVAPPFAKRRFDRFSTAAYAKLVYTRRLGERKSAMVVTGALLQLSEEGIMLRTNEPVPIHTSAAVELHLGDEPVVVLGTVRHCTDTVGAFKVGLELSFLQS
ncbi:MAG: PilZ domain-containing protein [Planctomycetes bacterium]|nr:PilZ domain-containing protein [Planctomycetota bacterium]